VAALELKRKTAINNEEVVLDAVNDATAFKELGAGVGADDVMDDLFVVVKWLQREEVRIVIFLHHFIVYTVINE